MDLISNMEIEQQVYGMHTVLFVMSWIQCTSTIVPKEKSGSDCSWIKCYNSGTIILQDQHCVCKCLPGFSGILCEKEMKQSHWPDGPYALLMPSTGCPETETHGWSPGYINITTLKPIEIRMLSNGPELQTGGSDASTKLAGQFGKYTIQLNFCFKHTEWPSHRHTIWTAETVTVFGGLSGCPKGMVEEERVISLPEISSWWSDGYLPFFEIRVDDNGTAVLTKECHINATESKENKITSAPFIFMKRQDENCTITHDTGVEEETMTILDENSTELTSIVFCIHNPIVTPGSPEKPGPSGSCKSPNVCSENDDGKGDGTKEPKEDENKDKGPRDDEVKDKRPSVDEIKDQESTLSCQKHLGLIDGTIEDFQIMASSWDGSDTPHNARAFDTGWCPSPDDLTPYIQIDLFSISLIGGLTLYHRVNFIDEIENNIYSRRLVPEGCRSFMVSYGVFPDGFVKYIEKPFIADPSQVFEQPQTFLFLRPFLARYVRIHPKEPVHGGRLCLRIELLGCDTTASLTSICDKDSKTYWAPLSSIYPASRISTDSSHHVNITSIAECRNACKAKIGLCKAIEYITNQTCNMYTSPFPGTSEATKYEPEITRSLLVCKIDKFSPEHISLKHTTGVSQNVVVSHNDVFTNIGYPMHYKSNTEYTWMVNSAHGGFIRLTFTLIDLYSQSIVPGRCAEDILILGDPFKNIKAFQNGRTPTIPTDKENFEIALKTCPRVFQQTDRRQGFRIVVKIEDLPTIWTERLHSPVLKGHIMSLRSIGLGGRLLAEQIWVYSGSYSKGLCILTITYFDLPCAEYMYMVISDGFKYDAGAICNEQRRPLREYRAWSMEIEYLFMLNNPSTEADTGFRASFRIEPFTDYPSWLTGTNVTEQVLDDHVTVDNAYHHVCSSQLNKCYTYSRTQTYADWNRHARSCHKLGYHQLVIHSRQEMDNIQTLLLNLEKDYLLSLKDTDPPNFIYTHLGLVSYQERTRRPKHIWQDGTSPTFTAWGPGQPYNRFEDLCTGMKTDLTTGIGHWVTCPCTSNSIPKYATAFVSVCEKPSNPLHNSDIVHSNITENAETHKDPEHTMMLFQCNSAEWVIYLAVCDGVRDCFDGSDEDNCSLHLQEQGVPCSSEEYTCGNGHCIHVGQVCDFVQHCPDGSDEYCTFPECKADEYTCTNKQCIPLYARCDAVYDCFDWSDEFLCGSCNQTIAFSCGDMTCVPRSLVCDNVPNCDDGRDEGNCPKTFNTCNSYWNSGFDKNFTKQEPVGNFHLECQFVLVDTQVLRITSVLEFASIWFTINPTDRSNALATIKAEDVKVHGEICTLEISERCIYSINEIASYTDPTYSGSFSFCRPKSVHIFTDGKTFWLDGVNDTVNRLDFEINANILNVTLMNVENRIYEASGLDNYSSKVGPVVCTTELNITYINCGDGMIVSRDRRCLFEYTRAGTIDGCRNYKHLEDCEMFTCPFGFSKCPSSFCVAQRLVCDGERQCPGGEDEKDCGCGMNNYTVLLTYPGVPSRRIQENVLLFARQFYAPSVSIYAVDYFNADTVFKVNIREVHPFNEALNLARMQTFEAKADSLEFELIARFDDKSHVNIISIEPDGTAKPLITTAALNVSNVVHLYHVHIDASIQPLADLQTNKGETHIAVKSMRLLSQMGSKLFTSLCKESSPPRNILGFKCTSSTIYIPMKQTCDGISQCPFGDDEAFCNFQCLNKCSCKPYLVNCKSSGLIEDDLYEIDPATRILDVSFNEIFKNGRLSIRNKLPFLIKLYVKQCKLTAIEDGTFTNTRSLVHLDLSFNEIRVLRTKTFFGLKYVKVLKLEGNAFLSILEPNSFHMLSFLTDLSITESSISEILPYTFSGLKLNILNISYNNVRTIHADAFNNLIANQIIFDGNEIQNFDAKLFSGVQNLNSIRSPSFKFCCYKPSSVQADNCWPHENEFSSCEDLMKNSILQTLLWMIGAAALVGNGVTVMYRLINDRKRIKKGFGMFVLNLAVSDFLMGVYLIIIATADITFRQRYIMEDEYWRQSIWCNMAGILATVSSETSVGFMCLITVDRFLVIKFPFGQWRFGGRASKIAVTVTWSISAIIALVPVMVEDYFQNSFYSTSGVCLAMPLTRRRPPGWLYSFVIYVAVNFVAFILIAFGQLAIFLEIRRSSKRMEQFKSQRRNDITIAKNLLLVLTTDFLCWFPVGVMAIMAYGGHVIPGDVYAWTAVLILPINSALNPFLYTLSAVVSFK